MTTKRTSDPVPSTEPGRVYLCVHCPDADLHWSERTARTLAESQAHTRAEHPETIVTRRATPEQMAAGRAMIASLFPNGDVR